MVFGLFSKNQANENIKNAIKSCSKESLEHYRALEMGIKEMFKGVDLSNKANSDELVNYINNMLVAMRSKRESMYISFTTAIEEIYNKVQPIFNENKGLADNDNTLKKANTMIAFTALVMHAKYNLIEKTPENKKATKVDNKFCSQCGSKIDTSNKFCGKCGIKLK